MTSIKPRLHYKCDRTSNPYFEIFDPASGRHYSFSSQQEVQAWYQQKYPTLTAIAATPACNGSLAQHLAAIHLSRTQPPHLSTAMQLS